MDDYKNLLTKTAVGELKKQLKAGGMRGYSKMKKSEIISLMVTKKLWEGKAEGKAEDPVSVLEEVKVEALPEEVKPVKAEKSKRKRPKAVEAKAVEAKQVARDA